MIMGREAVGWFGLTVVAGLGLVAAACAETAVAPEDPPEITPSEETENVYVIAPGDSEEEAVILNGRLFGGEHDFAVILAHARPSDQTAWFDFAERLAGLGFAALTFNFRGFGESEGEQDFDVLDQDLTAMLQYLRDRGKTSIFLVGASMGGTASLVVAGREDVAGVVAVSAPAEFEEQNALEAAPNVNAPKLLIAAEGDVQAMISLERIAELTPQPLETETYPGNLHGTALLGPDSDFAQEVAERILRFLEEHRAR